MGVSAQGTKLLLLFGPYQETESQIQHRGHAVPDTAHTCEAKPVPTLKILHSEAERKGAEIHEQKRKHQVRDAISHQPTPCFAMVEQCKDPDVARKTTDFEGLTHEFLWGLPVSTLPFLKAKWQPSSSYRNSVVSQDLPLGPVSIAYGPRQQPYRQCVTEGPLVLGHQTRTITPNHPERSSLEGCDICQCHGPWVLLGVAVGLAGALPLGGVPDDCEHPAVRGAVHCTKAGEGSEGISDCSVQTMGHCTLSPHHEGCLGELHPHRPMLSSLTTLQKCSNSDMLGLSCESSFIPSVQGCNQAAPAQGSQGFLGTLIKKP